MYKYELNSVISVHLSGNDAQETKLTVKSDAHVFAEDNCNFALQLQNLEIFGPDNKRNAPTEELHANRVVRFTLGGNDELGPEICTEADDTPFGLNIKRAIISLLQSADSKSYETDVFGTCPTSFSSTKSGDSTYVTKTRNLNACGFRETLSNGLITGVINENSDVKSTPLLNGDYTAEQQIKSGILERVQVSEEYSFVPFSSGDAGAKAKVTTKLQLKSQGSGKASGDAAKVATSRTLLFENSEVDTVRKLPENTLKNALSKAIEQHTPHIGSKAAGQYRELIRLLRYAKKDDLLVFFKNVNAGTVNPDADLSRRIYLDALFRTGTSASVQAITDLLKELKDNEKRLAYLSFNLVKSVDKSTLPAINVSTRFFFYTVLLLNKIMR